MADNIITGRAKKHDGTAIDYVSIFNWSDGKCIAQVVPNTSGDWQYPYNKNLKVGFTYVANGCEPITHGPYDFTYEYNLFADTILRYDFNGDVLDKSVNGLNGIKTGNANFVTGRKAGTQALEFVSGCVRTPQVLPINSNSLSVSFWMKTTGTIEGIVYETSVNAYNNPGGVLALTDGAMKIQSAFGTGTGFNITKAPLTNVDGFNHVVITVDKSNSGANENKIYINNVLVSDYLSGNQSSSGGLLINDILYIGQRTAASVPFAGALQDMRFYNRVLTEAERTQLFNE